MASPSSSASPLSGNLAIDLLTTGYKWHLDWDRKIHWSISGGFDGEYWISPGAVIGSFEKLFEILEYYISVDFVFSGNFSDPSAAYFAGADINIAPESVYIDSPAIWAIGAFPYSGIFPGTYNGIPGDIFININSPANNLPSYELGSAGWALALHEVGHALGLKHTHDDGGTGRPTFSEVDLGDLDRDWVSIMSYGDDFKWDLLFFDPATPMGLDVLALQYLYGANMSTNVGDTVYSLELINSYLTIWDAGGFDAVDVSRFLLGWRIELPSDFDGDSRTQKLGFATPISDFYSDKTLHFYWLVGDMENILGSQGPDEIFGNELNNIIYGALGDDYIDGGDGYDILGSLFLPSQYSYDNGDIVGPEGVDTIVNVETVAFTTPSGQYTVYVDLDDLVVPVSGTSSDSDVTELLKKVSDLFIAFFDRAPRPEGLLYWFKQLYEGTSGLDDLSRYFTDQNEYREKYPDTLSNRQFVETVFENLFDRKPAQSGWDYWTNTLDSGALGRDTFIFNVIEGAYSPTGGAQDRMLMNNKHDVSLYYVEKLSLYSAEEFDEKVTVLLNKVSGNEATVLQAKSIIDYVFESPITLSGVVSDPDLWDSFWG